MGAEGGSQSAGRVAAEQGGVKAGQPDGPAGPVTAVRGGVVAVSSGAERSSLDLGRNNSTDPEPAETGRYDCRHVYQNFQFESDGGGEASYRCGSWDCYCCGYRMRQNLVEEIGRVCRERPDMSRLLTLTLNPAKVPPDKEPHKYLTERWNALRTRLKREIGDFSYVWVREEQENGNPHLHAIVSRFLPQQVVSKAWAELGGGKVVDIRQVDRVEKVAHYVGKYLTKNALTDLPDGIQRYNSSADITLAVRNGGESSDEWSLMMKDYALNPDGEPLKREVTKTDFIQQREWGGPVPPD